jgi:hypothetical protein
LLQKLDDIVHSSSTADCRSTLRDIHAQNTAQNTTIIKTYICNDRCTPSIIV